MEQIAKQRRGQSKIKNDALSSAQPREFSDAKESSNIDGLKGTS
jgi:hypothetical protein